MRTARKRTGSSRGSHTTWSEGDSRTCHHCGKTLRITRDPALWIHTDDVTGTHTSTHAACGPPWKETTMSDTTTEPETPTPLPDPQPEPVSEPEPEQDEDGNEDEEEAEE